MGCILSVAANLISHLLYFSQKFLYCFTCAALVSCLVMTIFLTLGMGIGIGYNYCYVDFKSKHRYVPAKYRKYNPTPHWKRSAPTDITVPNNLNAKGFRAVENTTETLATDKNITSTRNLERAIEENETSTERDPEMSLDDTSTEDSSKMIVPISGLDLIALLSKLRSENRNYSLQIITT